VGGWREKFNLTKLIKVPNLTRGARHWYGQQNPGKGLLTDPALLRELPEESPPLSTLGALRKRLLQGFSNRHGSLLWLE